MSEKPSWLSIKPPTDEYYKVKSNIKQKNLVTVCEESRCPNISECWSGGTATFMVLGDECTRACKFCAIKTAFSRKPPDRDEPEKLSKAIMEMKLDYVVITSVDRDDLLDQGSIHFANCIKTVNEKNKIHVEVLIPDFKGNERCIERIVQAGPKVIAHNVETVRRLQNKVRDPRAGYEQSISVLKCVKKMNPKIYTKSAIMVGLGETDEEIIQTMKDLIAAKVQILTIGQYLRPSEKHLNVKKYVSPKKFEYYKKIGEKLGFIYVASGPFVRSSYKAGEFFMKKVLEFEKND